MKDLFAKLFKRKYRVMQLNGEYKDERVRSTMRPLPDTAVAVIVDAPDKKAQEPAQSLQQSGYNLPGCVVDQSMPAQPSKPSSKKRGVKRKYEVFSELEPLDINTQRRIINYIDMQCPDALRTLLQTVDAERYVNAFYSRDGLTPAMHAAIVGNAEILEILKDNKAKFFGERCSLGYDGFGKPTSAPAADNYSHFLNVAKRDGNATVIAVFSLLKQMGKSSRRPGLGITTDAMFGPLQFSALAGNSDAFMFILNQAPDNGNSTFYNLFNFDMPPKLYLGLDISTLNAVINGNVGGVDAKSISYCQKILAAKTKENKSASFSKL